MNHIEAGKGCAQHLGWGKDERGVFEILCRKIAEDGSSLCPHHKLLLEEGHLDDEAKAIKRANTKARKQSLRDALPDSPLRAENPQFAQKPVETGYER